MNVTRAARPLSLSPSGSSRAGALTALGLATVLSSLGASSAPVALPALAAAFGAPFSEVQAVVLAYLLSVTAIIVGIGRLGDRLGRRRLLLAGLAVFTGASLLGGLAPTLWVLIGARLAQGMGAAAMIALTLSLVGDTVAPGRAGRAMGLLGTMSALGTALGPSLGGVLMAAAGWRAIFLVNLPLGLVAWWLVRQCLPPDRARPRSARPAFDPVGALLFGAALASYVLALAAGAVPLGLPRLGWAGAAVVSGILFAAREAQAPAPLVPLELVRDHGRAAGLLASALVAAVMMSTLVVGPFYLSFGLGLGAIDAGLVLSIGPLAAALAGVPLGQAVDRFGGPRATLAGLAGMSAGAVLLVLIPDGWGVPGYVGPLVGVTMGYSLFQTANNTTVLGDLPDGRRGVVSGLLSLSRNIGLLTGASLLGSVFAAAAGTNDLAAAGPTAVASGMRVTYAVAAALTLLALAITATRRQSGRSLVPGWWRI